MEEYFYLVNLDKLEFIDPTNLGIGLKAREQFFSFPSTPQALFVLLLMSQEQVETTLESLAEEKEEPVIGRWAGDRLALIGTKAKNSDLTGELPHPASRIFQLCEQGQYTDISGLVRPLIATEFGIKYYRDTDGNWKFRRDENNPFSSLFS